jgi:chromosomal replication initiation ATPase DnaA
MNSPVPPRQLPLDLALDPRFGREDFLVGTSNEAAFEAIERWPEWPAPVLMLVGPEGSGKSHLAAIWAQVSRADTLSARYLGRRSPASFATCKALVLEDADVDGLAEASLFHLMNIFRDSGAALLITARRRPDLWGLATPDLLSRLRLAPVAEIHPPDDALLRALIVKLFIDRQLIVDTNVVEYVLARIERSFAAVAATVDALDREALALGRRVTRPVAAQVLGRNDTSDA